MAGEVSVTAAIMRGSSGWDGSFDGIYAAAMMGWASVLGPGWATEMLQRKRHIDASALDAAPRVARLRKKALAVVLMASAVLLGAVAWPFTKAHLQAVA